jgi:hypothetical protein
MQKIEDKYETLEDAKLNYDSEKGWGLNEAAVDVINSILSGVRDGWYFNIKMNEESGETEFLRAADELRETLLGIGIYSESGIYHRRRPKGFREKRPEGRPTIMVSMPKKLMPAEIITYYTIFIAISEEIPGIMQDCYYRAFGSRGGVLIADAAKIDPKINQCITILASVLGVPGDIIEECMKNKRHLAGILIFPGPFRNSKHSENLDKSWSKYIFWRYWDTPFENDKASPSREAAINCMSALKSSRKWTPEGW